jgi:hypothetical protein
MIWLYLAMLLHEVSRKNFMSAVKNIEAMLHISRSFVVTLDKIYGISP